MKDPLRPVSEEFIRERVETNHREVVNGAKVQCGGCSWVAKTDNVELGHEHHQSHKDDLVQSLLTAPY